ncbi:unnamed protein product [Closterium sp. NIES-54]
MSSHVTPSPCHPMSPHPHVIPSPCHPMSPHPHVIPCHPIPMSLHPHVTPSPCHSIPMSLHPRVAPSPSPCYPISPYATPYPTHPTPPHSTPPRATLASTAAGTGGTAVLTSERPHVRSLGIASGMAPGAHLAIYKVLWTNATLAGYGELADVHYAIDRAIKDGVDVLSLSLGGLGPDQHYFDDLLYLLANQAGMVVVTAAGNQGPAPNLGLWNRFGIYRTISNFSPFYLTVGASSIGRRFLTELRLGSGKVVYASGVGSGTYATRRLPLLSAADAAGPDSSLEGVSCCSGGGATGSAGRGSSEVCQNVPSAAALCCRCCLTRQLSGRGELLQTAVVAGKWGASWVSAACFCSIVLILMLILQLNLLLPSHPIPSQSIPSHPFSSLTPGHPLPTRIALSSTSTGSHSPLHAGHGGSPRQAALSGSSWRSSHDPCKRRRRLNRPQQPHYHAHTHTPTTLPPSHPIPSLPPHTHQATHCLPESLSPARAWGAIVLCTRGMVGVQDKLRSVAAAGGVAMILANEDGGLIDLNTLSATAGAPIPFIHVNLAQARIIRAYIQSTPKPTATIMARCHILENAAPPMIASFSSTGPTVNPRFGATAPYPTNDILKPDVVAPGVDIWAAWTGQRRSPISPMAVVRPRREEVRGGGGDGDAGRGRSVRGSREVISNSNRGISSSSSSSRISSSSSSSSNSIGISHSSNNRLSDASLSRRPTAIGRSKRPSFALLSGTSMATPHVAGIAAMVVQAHPGWTPAQVMSAILTTARSSYAQPAGSMARVKPRISTGLQPQELQDPQHLQHPQQQPRLPQLRTAGVLEPAGIGEGWSAAEASGAAAGEAAEEVGETAETKPRPQAPSAAAPPPPTPPWSTFPFEQPWEKLPRLGTWAKAISTLPLFLTQD